VVRANGSQPAMGIGVSPLPVLPPPPTIGSGTLPPAPPPPGEAPPSTTPLSVPPFESLVPPGPASPGSVATVPGAVPPESSSAPASASVPMRAPPLPSVASTSETERSDSPPQATARSAKIPVIALPRDRIGFLLVRIICQRKHGGTITAPGVRPVRLVDRDRNAGTGHAEDTSRLHVDHFEATLPRFRAHVPRVVQVNRDTAGLPVGGTRARPGASGGVAIDVELAVDTQGIAVDRRVHRAL